ncbi:Hypothetical protein D9617_20g028060 [Elsinoe fawcettii]|nr:Hypothetical protein D9617_20g028060 [Elsinoe fawcettii]
MGAGSSKAEINKNLHEAARQLNEEQAQSQSKTKRTRVADAHVLFNNIINSPSRVNGKAPATDQALRRTDRDAAKRANEETHRQFSKNKTQAFEPKAARPAQKEPNGRPSGKLPMVRKSKTGGRSLSRVVEAEPPRKTRGRPRKHPRVASAVAAPDDESSTSQPRAMRRSKAAAADPQSIPGPSKRRKARAPSRIDRKSVSGQSRQTEEHEEEDGKDVNEEESQDEEHGTANGTAQTRSRLRRRHQPFVGKLAENGEAGEVECDDEEDEEEVDEDEDDEEGVQTEHRNGESQEPGRRVQSGSEDSEDFEVEQSMPQDRSAWWYGTYTTLYEAENFVEKLIAADDSLEGEPQSISGAVNDIEAQVASLRQGASPDQSLTDSVHEVLSNVKNYRKTIRSPSATLTSDSDVAINIGKEIAPRLVRLLWQLLHKFSAARRLSKDQLEIVTKVAKQIKACKTAVEAIKHRHEDAVTVPSMVTHMFSRISEPTKAFCDQLAGIKEAEQRELDIAMATEPARIRESQRWQREREAAEAPLIEWRRRWLALHVDRTEAESANFTRVLPRGKAALLRATPVDRVATTEKPWVLAWRASQTTSHNRPSSAIPRPLLPSQPPTTDRPTTPPARTSPELDANGRPFERVSLTPRRTPRPRNPSSPRDTADGISSWPLDRVTRLFSALSYSGPAFSQEQDDALFAALERHRGHGQWKGVIWDTCAPSRDAKTGAWSDGMLVDFTVGEIVERGVWWRDVMWLDPERHEKGVPLSGWVRDVVDVRVRPGGVATVDEEDEE